MCFKARSKRGHSGCFPYILIGFLFTGRAEGQGWGPDFSPVGRLGFPCGVVMRGAVGSTPDVAQHRTAAHSMTFAANACRAWTWAESHGCTAFSENFLMPAWSVRRTRVTVAEKVFSNCRAIRAFPGNPRQHWNSGARQSERHPSDPCIFRSPPLSIAHSALAHLTIPHLTIL